MHLFCWLLCEPFHCYCYLHSSVTFDHDICIGTVRLGTGSSPALLVNREKVAEGILGHGNRLAITLPTVNPSLQGRANKPHRPNNYTNNYCDSARPCHDGIIGKSHTEFALGQSANIQNIDFEWRRLAHQYSPDFVIPDQGLQLEGFKAFKSCVRVFLEICRPFECMGVCILVIIQTLS